MNYHECAKCGNDYTLRYGQNPTKYCDQCAHELADELELRLGRDKSASLKKRLFDILNERSFQRGEFRLSSGEVSDYYIDGKMSATYSKAASLIGEVLYERTKDLQIDAIGGLEVGAVALVTAAVISYDMRKKEMEGFWVRDKKKEHGTKKRIEGKMEKGDRVVIVDDVFTKGDSAMRAARAAQEAGATVVAVIALVDRLRGARELFEREGIEYIAVFNINDFGVFPNAACRM